MLRPHFLGSARSLSAQWVHNGTWTNASGVWTNAPGEGGNLYKAEAQTFGGGVHSSYVRYGTNELVADNGRLRCAYVDNANGFYTPLRATQALTEDLTNGTWYRWGAHTQSSAAGVPLLNIAGGTVSFNGPSHANPSEAVRWITFAGASATAQYVRLSSFASGHTIWWNNVFLRKINLADIVCRKQEVSEDGMVTVRFTGLQWNNRGTAGGIAARVASSTDYLACFYDGGGAISLMSFSGGTGSVLQKTTVTMTSGTSRLRLQLAGTTAKVFWAPDGNTFGQLGTDQTVPASTATSHGMLISAPGLGLRDYEYARW